MTDALLQFGFPAALAFYCAGALISLALSSRANERSASTLSHIFAALGASTGLSLALAVFFTGTTVAIHAGGIGLAADVLNFRIDGLAAFFIGAISAVALAASVYGIGYQKQFLGVYRLGSFGFFYNIFLGCMLAVVAANYGILFLFAWEAMAISSYFLV